MNNVVSLIMTKETYIQFRVRDDIKTDLQVTAELRGLSVSALITSLIVKTIREEKELSPQSFHRTEVRPERTREVNKPQGARFFKTSDGKKLQEKKKTG